MLLANYPRFDSPSILAQLGNLFHLNCNFFSMHTSKTSSRFPYLNWIVCFKNLSLKLLRDAVIDSYTTTNGNLKCSILVTKDSLIE